MDQIELTGGSLPDGEYSSTVIHLIERLWLSVGGKSVVLDRAIIANGALLLDNA